LGGGGHRHRSRRRHSYFGTDQHNAFVSLLCRSSCCVVLYCAVCAGHETTAAVLTWALFCVVQNPQVEAKLLAEIDAVVGDRTPGVWGGGCSGWEVCQQRGCWHLCGGGGGEEDGGERCSQGWEGRQSE
jgi:hypothetical protein